MRLDAAAYRSRGGVAGTPLAIGLGVAAGAVLASGERLARTRRAAIALDHGDIRRSYRQSPDRTRAVTTSDGVDLHVEIDEPRGLAADSGDAATGRPTVVFSHGYCLTLDSWVFQRRAMRDAGYRTVLWDLRGHGRSGPGPDQDYTIDRLGEDLLQVIETICPDGPLVLVGHSTGGMAMMALADAGADLVRDRVVGAGFVSTSAAGMASVTFGLAPPVARFVLLRAPAKILSLQAHPALVSNTVRATRVAVDAFVHWLCFGEVVPMSLLRLTTDMIVGTRADTISALLPGFAAHDKRVALHTFDAVETLVLCGTADKITPPGHSDLIASLVPRSRRVVVPGAGHLIMFECPEQVTAEVLGLIRRAVSLPARSDDREVCRSWPDA